MSIFSDWLVRTEAEVKAIAIKIVAGEQVAIAKINAAADWLSKNSGTIEADLEALLGVAETLGAPISPATVIGVQAVAASFAAFAAAHNAGQSTASSVAAGYASLTQANGLISTATATTIQSAMAKVSAVAGVAQEAVVAATKLPTPAPAPTLPVVTTNLANA